jgi:hypothetical protein
MLESDGDGWTVVGPGDGDTSRTDSHASLPEGAHKKSAPAVPGPLVEEGVPVVASQWQGLTSSLGSVAPPLAVASGPMVITVRSPETSAAPLPDGSASMPMGLGSGSHALLAGGASAAGSATAPAEATAAVRPTGATGPAGSTGGAPVPAAAAGAPGHGAAPTAKSAGAPATGAPSATVTPPAGGEAGGVAPPPTNAAGPAAPAAPSGSSGPGAASSSGGPPVVLTGAVCSFCGWRVVGSRRRDGGRAWWCRLLPVRGRLPPVTPGFRAPCGSRCCWHQPHA